MRILIKGGHVIDPGNLDGVMDILVQDGLVKAIEIPGVLSEVGDVKIIDAQGKVVTPGLIDMHVHLREPGFEHKETIKSGCEAAACGGFTAVCPMPNTHPVCDNVQTVQYIINKAKDIGSVRVFPVAAISRNLKGERPCDYSELKAAGAVALTDDGYPVMNSLVMRHALDQAAEIGVPVISHSEDLPLADGGAMNEGVVATQLSVKGIPNAAESIMVMRDIALCELTGGHLHIAHVSTAEAVDAIRQAKGRGVRVTAETAPHYFTLTEQAVAKYGANAKMNPPLRSDKDREAIIEGLVDGTIDAIATDHAPHTPAEKAQGLEKAPNGIIGLETSVPISLQLVKQGILSLPDLIRKMATNPAVIMGLESGIKIGKVADITMIDPDRPTTIDAENFKSLSRNTPFDQWDLEGQAVLTMVGGRIIYENL